MHSLFKAREAIEKDLGANETKTETWLEDHELAMQIFDTEDLVSDVISSFDSLIKLDKKVVDYVICGKLSVCDETVYNVKDLKKRWLKLAVAVDRDLVGMAESLGFAIENKTDLLNRIELAKTDEAQSFEAYENSLINSFDVSYEIASKNSTPFEAWPDDTK
jgi:hypothetical protein